MQLPPTIISIDKEKKDKAKKKARQTSGKTSKTTNGNEEAPPSPESGDDSGVSGDKMMKASPISTKKLQPVLVPPRTLETTLFDRLEQMYGSRIKRMLEIQYRYAYTTLP